jgi:hypothetical protein
MKLIEKQQQTNKGKTNGPGWVGKNDLKRDQNYEIPYRITNKVGR